MAKLKKQYENFKEFSVLDGERAITVSKQNFLNNSEKYRANYGHYFEEGYTKTAEQAADHVIKVTDQAGTKANKKMIEGLNRTRKVDYGGKVYDIGKFKAPKPRTKPQDPSPKVEE